MKCPNPAFRSARPRPGAALCALPDREGHPHPLDSRSARRYLGRKDEGDGMANHLHDALFGRHEGSAARFLILPDGSEVSHADFAARAARYAGALRSAGLGPGDRVALQLGKSPDMLAVIAGAIRAGVVFLPLNPA